MAGRSSLFRRLQRFLQPSADIKYPTSMLSVLGEPDGSFPNQFRTRRMEAALFSVFVHASIIFLAVLLVQKSSGSLSFVEKAVVIHSPFFDLPADGDGGGNGAGGGGGGGRRERASPAWGAMPAESRLQLTPPDPNEPQPMIPADDAMTIASTMAMPVDMPQNQNLPIGDVTAPFSTSRNYGPGSGNGIGDGDGTGIGDGDGPGYGRGKNGGYGNGNEGALGKGGNGVYGPGIAGLKNPEVLCDPRPAYTEEARKTRTEGSILVQAIIRKDGTIDSFRVLRGLGHGLDESAVRTISTKWRFKPGRLNGAPVDVLANIEVTFRLY